MSILNHIKFLSLYLSKDWYERVWCVSGWEGGSRCSPVHVSVEARDCLWEPHPTPYLRQVLLMEMEIITPARLAGSWALGIHSFPLPPTTGLNLNLPHLQLEVILYFRIVVTCHTTLQSAIDYITHSGSLRLQTSWIPCDIVTIILSYSGHYVRDNAGERCAATHIKVYYKHCVQ